MTGLLRAEVKRLTSRRLVRVLLLIFLGILLLTQLVAAARSREASASDRAIAAAQQQQCRSDQEVGMFPEGVSCEEAFAAPERRFVVREVLPEMAGGIGGTAALMAFVIGAAYVGADWAAGTMQALLFWEPRRGRVILAKAAALVGVTVAATAVLQLVGWSTSMLIGMTRGTTEGVTSGLQQSAFLTMGRGLVIVAFAALLGFAIAGLARVTGAAMGAGLGYFVLVELMLLSNLRPGWIRYLVGPNIAAVLANGVKVPSGKPQQTFEGFVVPDEFLLTGTRGTVTLAIYLVIVVGAFAVSFHRRDVT